MRMTVTTGVDRPGIVSRMGIMVDRRNATKIPDDRGFGNPRVSRWYAPSDATPGAFLGRGHHAVPRATAPRPRAAALTAGRLARFVEDVGGLQLDSINVLERRSEERRVGKEAST